MVHSNQLRILLGLTAVQSAALVHITCRLHNSNAFQFLAAQDSIYKHKCAIHAK